MVNFKKILDRFMYKDRANVYRSSEKKIGKSDDTTRKYACVYQKRRKTPPFRAGDIIRKKVSA